MTGCAEEPIAPSGAASLDRRGANATANVPVRGADAGSLIHYAKLSDSALWAQTSARGALFSLGLKSPGTNRGQWQGRRLIADRDWLEGRAAIAHLPGIEVRAVDSLRPRLTVAIASLEALARLRRLPFTDFLEPKTFDPQYFHLASGCDWPANDAPYTMDASMDILPETYKRILVHKAWAYSNGQGVLIGFTDTGVGGTNSDWTLGVFSSGESAPRNIYHETTTGEYTAFACSHGNRIGGVLAAPRNGQRTQGIAWKADFLDIRHNPDVLVSITSDRDAADAIRLAASRGAGVINMSWGSATWLDDVADEIDYWYWQPRPYDPVFVAAAGTSYADLPKFMLFPSTLSNVLAVSAIDFDGFRDNQSHHGPELDLVAYHHVPAPGYSAYELSSAEHSSSATAHVSGVATLVRSRYPQMSNHDVVDRLRSTANDACQDETSWGNLVNALAAVGGPCVRISGPTAVAIREPAGSTTATYSVTASGDNAFAYSYLWGNSGITTSSPTTTTWRFGMNATRTSYYTTVFINVTDNVTGIVHPRTVRVYVNYIRDEGNGGPCGGTVHC